MRPCFCAWGCKLTQDQMTQVLYEFSPVGEAFDRYAVVD